MHRITCDRRKVHGEELNLTPLGLGMVRDPFTVDTADLSLGLLLTPQIVIDGATFEQRLGYPEPVVHAAEATSAFVGLTPMPATVLKTAPPN